RRLGCTVRSDSTSPSTEQTRPLIFRIRLDSEIAALPPAVLVDGRSDLGVDLGRIDVAQEKGDAWDHAVEAFEVAGVGLVADDVHQATGQLCVQCRGGYHNQRAPRRRYCDRAAALLRILSVLSTNAATDCIGPICMKSPITFSLLSLSIHSMLTEPSFHHSVIVAASRFVASLSLDMWRPPLLELRRSGSAVRSALPKLAQECRPGLVRKGPTDRFAIERA